MKEGRVCSKLSQLHRKRNREKTNHTSKEIEAENLGNTEVG